MIGLLFLVSFLGLLNSCSTPKGILAYSYGRRPCRKRQLVTAGDLAENPGNLNTIAGAAVTAEGAVQGLGLPSSATHGETSGKTTEEEPQVGTLKNPTPETAHEQEIEDVNNT